MKPKVLFVDDEPELLESVQDALRKKPYRVVTANSGAEALTLLASDPDIRVVVSDERMPEMTGHELLAKVRAEYPGSVRIMLSGQADLNAIVSAINEGEAFRFLHKPCPAEDIHDIVMQALAVADDLANAGVSDPDAYLRQTALSLLERRHPGISQVERDERGCIVLDDRPTDVDELIAPFRP